MSVAVPVIALIDSAAPVLVPDRIGSVLSAILHKCSAAVASGVSSM